MSRVIQGKKNESMSASTPAVSARLVEDSAFRPFLAFTCIFLVILIQRSVHACRYFIFAVILISNTAFSEIYDWSTWLLINRKYQSTPDRFVLMVQL